MLQIQLYIENEQGVLEEVELYSDESITLTQSIQDIKDIEKVFTDYSKTFNVPASKHNNKFFKHFYNYFIDGFDARRKKKAELHLNYKPFKKGKIKLEGTTLKNNEAHTYKVTFFGNTVTLKDLIGEDKLGNLTHLDVLDFAWNDTNIANYMSNGLDGNVRVETIEDAILIPLITHTDRLIYDSTDTAAGTNNLYYSLLATNAHGVNFNQLKPAIKLYAIIQAIEIKYNIRFSKDFFNKTNLPFYNLYMWLHTKEGSLFEDQDAQYTISGFTNVRGDVTDIVGVHNSYFQNTYDGRRYNRTIRVKVTPSGSDEYGLVIKKNGEEFSRFTGLTGTTTNGAANNIEELEIPNGDYTFFIEATNSATFTVDITVLATPAKTITLLGKKQITFSGTAGVLTDEKINISSQLPKIKTLDFLAGLFKMFNLTSYVDDDGVIVVKTLDSFFAGSTNTWDITRHLAKDETVVDSVIPYRQVNLGYAGGETFLAKNHENLANKKWGTLEYASSDNFEGDAYNIELPFEHMKFERLIDSQTGQTNIQWGWSVDTKQSPTIGEPLLFYANNTIATIAAVNFAGNRVNIQAPFVPSNSLVLTNLFGDDQSQSLNYHAEYDEYTGNPNENTLFNTYYKNYIKDLFDKRKRLTQASAYLPLSITENLSLADKIIIFDKLYRINKITTNFETNRSQLELTNILEETAYDVSPYATSIDLSSDFITADTTLYTADIGNLTVDGFTLPPETTEVPNTIPSNEPKQTSTQPCIVTEATITGTRAESFCDKLKFYGEIGGYGTICGQLNIDEYGFLLATSQSYLTASDDIDTLKADSNIEVIPIQRQTGAATLQVGEKVVTKSNLTDPATYYARFYTRTNTNELHAFADDISEVFTETTNCGEIVTTDTTIVTADNPTIFNGMAYDLDNDGQEDPSVEVGISVRFAGAGTTSGYLTEPSLSDIETNGYDFCDTIQDVQTIYHNGQGDYPVVGDKIKYLLSNNYLGGSDSLPYNNSTNDYGAFALADNNTVLNGQATIFKYFVYKISTAEVTAVYDCPVNQCNSTLYGAGGQISSVQGRAGIGTIGVRATISGMESYNPSTGITTKGTYLGIIYSNNYTALKNVSNPNSAADNYIANGTTPTNVDFAVIEYANRFESGSQVSFNTDGWIQNTQHVVRATVPTGKYYARIFIGWCDRTYASSQIIIVNSL